MAVLRTIRCDTCGLIKDEIMPGGIYSRECSSCRQAKSNQEFELWEAGRETIDVYERIKELETFMYNHTRKEYYSGLAVFGWLQNKLF